MNIKEFQYPSAVWRGKPFWSWNGELREEELLRQIHIMKEMGFGGYFMHSRTGLITEYLGKEWFDLINRCAEEGETLGLESWLYDEDRWPSGTAGGKVTENPDYRMKFIHLEIVSGSDFSVEEAKKSNGVWLGAWSCRLENDFDIYDLLNITEETDKEDYSSKTILVFRIIPMAEGSFYNGNTYVDTMKREATEEYLNITHEAYKEHCAHHFGKSIKGIFTDEPHRGSFMSGFSSDGVEEINPLFLVPWTDAFFDTFLDHYGYPVEEFLPQLFLRSEGQQVSQVKAHYAEILLQLFIDNFAKPCFDWCEENNLELTGHVLHENNFSSQVSTNGSVQRYYPHMHLPGVDVLGEKTADYWLVKQVDSTARQFGQKQILSELYGCTGWQMSFQQHKAIGAWQTLFGVNLRCHHLSWYSMQGEAKRDYPASILHQSPWYKEYDTVESWFARMGYFRSLGTPCCDLLVINPVESVWGRVYPGAIMGMDAADPGIIDLEEKYAELFHILAGNQIDFDYGDEGILAAHGEVEEDRGLLKVGLMKYNIVLVAGMTTIRKSTLELLNKFKAAGGIVIFAGKAPEYVESLRFSAAEDFAALCPQCRFNEKEISSTLFEHLSGRLDILDEETGDRQTEVFSQFRTDEQAEYLTILNMNRKESFKVTIKLNSRFEFVEEWQLDDGQGRRIKTEINQDLLIRPVGAIPRDLSRVKTEIMPLKAATIPNKNTPTLGSGILIFSVDLAPSEARCFRFLNQSEFPQVDEDSNKNTRSLKLTEACEYELSENNICVLDTARWNMNGEKWKGPKEILQIDSEVRKLLNIPPRGGNMVQPWFRGNEKFQTMGKLQLSYEIEIAESVLPSMNYSELVLETPDRFELFVNDEQIDLFKEKGFWVDIAFRRFSFPENIFKSGKNQILLSCDFAEDLNLEALYLLGDFAVIPDGINLRLESLPSEIIPGDLVKQGFPFYSGSFYYKYQLPHELIDRELEIKVPDYQGAYIKLYSGGNNRIIPWQPAETRFRVARELTIEVSITRKNTFGPLHNPFAHTGHIGPQAFVSNGEAFCLEPFFLGSGLIEPVEIEYSE